MSEFGWFVKICDWDYEHLDQREGADFADMRCLWQAIAAHLMGLDK